MLSRTGNDGGSASGRMCINLLNRVVYELIYNFFFSLYHPNTNVHNYPVVFGEIINIWEIFEQAI